MATPLDVGLFQKFDVIFPFIFVLVLVYAVLGRTEWLKEKQTVAFLIAFVMAVMTLFSNIAVRTINMMAPWVVLLIVFMVFVILAYTALGVKESTIGEVITGKAYGGIIAWWTLALLLVIGLGSLSTVVSEEVGFGALAEGEAAPGETGQIGFWATIFHPKVLGMILLLLIGMFTVQKLSAKAE